jgi:spermidine/putrescine transport system substrate-binding protein
MKRYLSNAFAAAALAGATPALAEGQLHIYNWGDYTNPKLLEKFTAETGIEVTLDDYDSNETMLAKVRAGNSGYDIVVPTDYVVKIMIDEGLLAETRPDQMANFKNVDPLWANPPFDPGRRYSVPWQWGTTGFAVDTDVYKGDINTWAILFDPPDELKGKINMQPSQDEVFAAAQRYLGIPRCTSDPQQLKTMYEMIVNAKQYWRTMDYGMIDTMVAGDTAASHGWNGAAMRVRLAKPTVAYAYPKEGFPVWMDNIVVLHDAPNMENAKIFQNFIMDPENAALVSDYAKYANAVVGSGAFLPAEFAEAPEIKMPEWAEPLGEFAIVCDQATVEKYTQLWTNLLK